jgi:hypothetical protein
MTSISPIPAASSADVSAQLANKKEVEIEDAATMLLPGLRQAQSLLSVAIPVLSHFAPPSPSAPSHAEAAAKIRRLLDEFGHPAATRR